MGKLKKILGTVVVLGAAIIGNPDHYFSECVIGGRHLNDLPYLQKPKIHQTWSREWMREHEMNEKKIYADNNWDFNVSWTEAIECLYERVYKKITGELPKVKYS